MAVGLVGLGLSDLGQLFTPLAALLATCAVAAELVAARYSTSLTVSAAFAADMLAVGFLGPAPAFVIPALSYGVVWIVERYRWRALLINIAGSSTPAMLVAYGFAAIDPPRHGPAFVALLAVATAVTMALNAAIVAAADGDPRRALDHREPARPDRAASGDRDQLRVRRGDRGGLREFGLAALAFVALNVIAVHVHAAAVVVARERTREYANLSWGVLSSLIRTLEERDSRAARHCAAVAAFSRDLAEQLGMSRREQELAHTSGLLHDIGKFALSDRVMERGGKLLDSDWRGIRRHPDIGARPPARHRRLRAGRRHRPRAPRARRRPRLSARPEGRRHPADRAVVAVAEVYDTLTAPDTYRTPMTSFEALNELRRVAGQPARRATTSRRWPSCLPAAASTTAMPTRPTSTASSTWSGG